MKAEGFVDGNIAVNAVDSMAVVVATVLSAEETAQVAEVAFVAESRDEAGKVAPTSVNQGLATEDSAMAAMELPSLAY